MAAAILRPGATTSADINDLHVSLGHAHEGNLRESEKQMGIRVTGTLVPCSECAAAKGIRRSVSRSTARRATRPLELLYGDLSGAMPASTEESVYCFFIVYCYSNLGWPIFLKDKSADTVTHAFRAFLAAIKPLREKHGEPGALRTDNGTEFVNEPFANLLVQYGIRREFTSVDGPKRNGRVERRIALVKEGACAAWLGFPRLFPDARLPAGQCTTLPCGRRHGQDVGKHQHHFARGRSGEEVPGRETVRQALAQTATAVPDAGTPHPGLGSQVGR